MLLQRAFFMSIFLSLSLYSAYEPLRYKEAISDVLKDLSSSQEFNETKIKALQNQEASLQQKKRERKSVAFEIRVAPVEHSTHSILEQLRAENRLIQADVTRLTQALTAQQLGMIKNEADETLALKRLELQSSLSRTIRNKARAAFAESFFEHQKRLAPDETKGLDLFQKGWAERQSKLSIQRAQQEALLRSLR